MDKTRTSVGAVLAIEEALRDPVAAAGVPSGELYTRSNLSIGEYNAVITALKKSGVVTESDNHLLTLTGDL
jgi:hypothetical protein